MEYTNLGRTGVKVSRMCLGCMTFGREIDEAASLPIMQRALDAGINFFDTANVYGNGASETIVGKALKASRHSIVLASKVYGQMGTGVNDRGLSRYHIMQAVEDSLQRKMMLYDKSGEEHFNIISALHKSVRSSDVDAALYAAKHLAASAVMVNDHTAFRTDWMPFAGQRQSGLGTGGIQYTMDDMLQNKMILLRHCA